MKRSASRRYTDVASPSFQPQWQHSCAARGAGMQVVAGAPNLLRGGSHSGNAMSELASEGLIDILSSDYYPSSLLRAVFWLVHETSMPLHEAVALAADNPARALGLSDLW